MGSISNFLEVELLDHVFNAAYTPPAAIYLALATADPTDAATGASMNEVPNLYSYARTAITFAAASARSVSQNAAVNYPQASGGSWGTVTHWAIVSTNTYGSGDVLASGAFAASKTINDGDTPSVASGEIIITVNAGEVSNYLANIVLDFAFRNQAFSSPATYVGLITATASDSDTGSSITEPGSNYGRIQVNVNGGGSPTWDLAVSGDPSYVDNTHAITFAQAAASWGTVVGMVIVDAATLGNLLFYDNDMTDTAINADDTAEFAIGALDVQLS